jgi:SAM-dependent methyltransferase
MHINGETEWQELVTLDRNPDCKPDVVHDLEYLPYPFQDNEFDEIHAYGVLEHLSDQGDYKSFFAQFSEFYRILKPEGLLFAIVPNDMHAQQWGDPSHRRAINAVTLEFLNQANYEQCGQTLMTDFRDCYKANFILGWNQTDPDLYQFVLQAVKPMGEVPGWTSANTHKE